jgi:hypothetical protein
LATLISTGFSPELASVMASCKYLYALTQDEPLLIPWALVSTKMILGVAAQTADQKSIRTLRNLPEIIVRMVAPLKSVTLIHYKATLPKRRYRVNKFLPFPVSRLSRAILLKKAVIIICHT